jgi:hypothetical protein
VNSVARQVRAAAWVLLKAAHMPAFTQAKVLLTCAFQQRPKT